MTDRTTSASSRSLVCARCGTAFGCDRDGACWCMDEVFRLPMPTDGGDCLCPDCLRAMAGKAPSFQDLRGRLLPASEDPESD